MGSVKDMNSAELARKVGQLLCLGWQGANNAESRTVNAHARAIVRELHAGSVILMARNLDKPWDTRRLISELQALADEPLFIAIDQEGGTLNRFKAPLHEFCGNMALGAIGEGAEELTYRQAQATARELRAMGINWDFAPVVDVNCNPENPIIGVRSYGEDPQLVARLGSAAIRGFQDTGMLACAKHFPGHGDTSTDSHVDLPVVTGDAQRMNAVELVPFKAAIDSQVGAVMTAHVLFPSVDPELPATLSSAVLTDLLRTQLGYDGLVITDCVEMKAISDRYRPTSAAVQAIKAGADIVLVCHTLETQRAVANSIIAALRSGEIPEERFNQALARVQAAKQRFLHKPQSVSDAPWTDSPHAELEQQIARKSITFVRSDDTLPLLIKPGEPLAVLSAHPSLGALVSELRRHHDSVTQAPIRSSFPAQDVAAAMNVARRAARILVATAPPDPWTVTRLNYEAQAKLVNELVRLQPDTVVVALREPYDLRLFPDARNYICTYSPNRCSLAALADALFGVYEATGRLPVQLTGG